jgi:hypothetical protein
MGHTQLLPHTLSPSFPRLDPAAPEDQQAWWDLYVPIADRWLEERFAEGDPLSAQAVFAASLLVAVPAFRTSIYDPPACDWEGISAHEILFLWLADGELLEPGWDHRFVAVVIQAFAAHLSALGLMPRDIGARLDAELDLWIPRLDDYLRHRTWYLADGTPLPIPGGTCRQPRLARPLAAQDRPPQSRTAPQRPRALDA